MVMLEYLKHCKKIGIDNSALYHYRLHADSVSYQFNDNRFDADVALHKQKEDFLRRFSAYDRSKQNWLNEVFLRSALETIRVLIRSSNSLESKVENLIRIIDHPQTAASLQNSTQAKSEFYHTIRQLFEHLIRLGYNDDSDWLTSFVNIAAPDCIGGISSETLPVYQKDKELRTLLCENKPLELAFALFERIRLEQFKKYPLGHLVVALCPGHVLPEACDTRFCYHNLEICKAVIRKDYLSALESMTDDLLKETVPPRSGSLICSFISTLPR